MTTLAEIRLWGSSIGAVSLNEGEQFAAFQYMPEFVRSQREVSPLCMPLSDRVYVFHSLPYRTFRGLPGLLADSLPDKFGNALIDAWLVQQGRQPHGFNAIERLCYTGTRGMGALEFFPALGPDPSLSAELDVQALVRLATEVLSQRSGVQLSLEAGAADRAMQQILRIGTSAAGARAKAVIAWNPRTNEVRSGQAEAPPGFEHWLLKFDGVSNNRDRELEDPKGYGAIEYAYHLMARAAGVNMADCRLLEEGGRRHFMTRRFDRATDGSKRHMQSLGGLAHYDFNAPGAHSYEQAFTVIRRLGLSMEDVEEQFRRMCFNVVARNQDDHVKNIAFLMDKSGQWRLSPAFDVTFAFNPSGDWTGQHQMSMNLKRDHFTRRDFIECGRTVSLKQGRAEHILDQVVEAVSCWSEFAAEARVATIWAEQISKHHRLQLAEG